MDKALRRWRGWGYKNTLFLALGLVFFFMLAETPQVDKFIRELGYLGRLGSLIAGFFFVATYTVVPAGYVLFELAKYQNALEVAVFAGIGAMLGDFIIFRFIRDRVMDEIQPLLSKVGNRKVRRLFKTPYFAWLVPVIGAIIVASPLPDELGVSLMGAAKMKSTHFLIITYVLNASGILMLVLLAQAVK